MSALTVALRSAAHRPVYDLPGLLVTAAWTIDQMSDANDRLVQRVMTLTGLPEGAVRLEEGPGLPRKGDLS